MTLPEIDHVSFLVEHAQTFFAGEGKQMFRRSLFLLSRQPNISTSCEERFKYPLPWGNKISQMPYLRANKDNQIPTAYLQQYKYLI